MGDQDDPSSTQLKVVSIVGAGGLGNHSCLFAVSNAWRGIRLQGFPVSMKPHIKQVLSTVLREVTGQDYINVNTESWDTMEIVNRIRNFLKDKRYSDTYCFSINTICRKVALVCCLNAIS